MKEQIKIYKKRLIALGFRRKSDRVFWYDNNGLFYVVTFKMEGGEIDQIGFEVSHAGMFEDGVPQQRCSPVGGWLGWEGMSTGIAAYVKELPVPQAAAILERATRAFFSYFKTAADWETAARRLQERTYLQFTPIAAREDAGGLSVPWFVNDIAREMQNPTDFGEALHALFEKLARQAGFSTVYDSIFVRQRGQVYDCFYVNADHLNTFFRVTPFIWCDQFEGGEDGLPAFSNLNNDLLPAVEWMRTADVLRDPSLAEALLQEIIAFCTRFETAMDWLDYLADGEHANFLAQKPEELAQLKNRLTEDADAAKTPHDTPMPQESGMEFEVNLQPSSIFEDMMGKHLYELTEGVGWNTGLRAAEVPESYYNAESLTCSSFGKWEYIMSASRQPREGERIMIWALQRDLTKEEDTYLLYYPMGIMDFETMAEEGYISAYDYEKVMSGLEIVEENEQSMLVRIEKGTIPYTEQMAKTELSTLEGMDWRIYRIKDVEKLLSSLPLIALVAVAIVFPIVLWTYTCVLARKEDENATLIKINAGIIAAMWLVLLVLMKIIDLPLSLMPLDRIFDMEHYSLTFDAILGALRTMSAGQSVLSLAGGMETAFWCVLAGGGVLTAAVVVVESVIARKLRG